jgi:hypothetical protein
MAKQGFLGEDAQAWDAVETLDRVRNAHYQRTGHYNSVSVTDALVRAGRYIAKVPPAISGQGGRTATLKVAWALIKGFRLHPNSAIQLFAEWNESCAPPWSYPQLELMLWQAHRKNGPDGFLLERRR